MMRRVPLDPGLQGRRTAYLRTPTGADELAAEDGAIAMLDRLLAAVGNHAVAPGSAAHLPVCDRDRLLAWLYRDLFDDRIDADAVCAGCGASFAVQFSISSMADAERPRQPPGIDGPDAECRYRLHGVAFRLPSSADLDAVAAVPAEDRRRALLERCVVAGDAGGHETAIEAAMAALGPTLDIDVDCRCPHCDSDQPLRFDIASFLLKSLANDRRFLLREAHRIARAYGWSHAEIMALPRAERQEFVRLIDDDAGAPRHVAAAE